MAAYPRADAINCGSLVDTPSDERRDLDLPWRGAQVTPASASPKCSESRPPATTTYQPLWITSCGNILVSNAPPCTPDPPPIKENSAATLDIAALASYLPSARRYPGNLLGDKTRSRL